MKTLLSLLSAAVSISAYAQITYNGTTMAGLGDTVFLAEDTTHAHLLDVGDPGGDQVWDFTSVTEDKPDGAIFEAPSTAPLHTLFPDAEFVANDIYEDSVHLFFNKTSTSLDIVGIVEYDSNGNPTPSVLSGEWRFMQFPAQFETTFKSTVLIDTQTSELGIDFDSTGPHPYIDSLRTIIKFSFYNEIDAWGEVQLPQGNFNTIRQKTSTVLNFKSDCYYDSAWHEFTPLMLTFFDNEQNDTANDASYRWWTADSKVNLFVCEIETDTNGMPDSSFSYTKETPTEPEGIDEHDGMHISLFPNPASEVLNVKSSEPIMGNLLLYDVRAKQVLSEPLNGDHASVSVRDLASGTYLLQISDNYGQLVKLEKVQIQH